MPDDTLATEQAEQVTPDTAPAEAQEGSEQEVLAQDADTQDEKPATDAPKPEPQQPKQVDWQKRYTDSEKHIGRLTNENQAFKRQMQELQEQVKQSLPKPAKPDPFEGDPVLSKLDAPQKTLLQSAVKAMLKAEGLTNLPQLQQKVENQERVFRQKELTSEVESLIKEVGKEAFEKYREPIAQKYEQIMNASGLSEWPAIPVRDVMNMVAADDLRKSAVERVQQNKEQRAARVASADIGKTNSKTVQPAELTSETLAKMSDRDAFAAIAKEMKAKFG
jgi:ribosomal protein S17E